MIKQTAYFTVLFLLIMVCKNQTNDDDTLVVKETPKISSTAFYKIGAPYKKHGHLYKPCLNEHYAKVGQASWYGPGFHGKKTANGDIFNKEDITAAHPTLPLYSRVKVTNLENGKTIIVTVNDRGPYHDKRIIDLSHKAAELLGYDKRGIAKVKVEYDKKETEKYLKEVGLYKQYLVANAK